MAKPMLSQWSSSSVSFCFRVCITMTTAEADQLEHDEQDVDQRLRLALKRAIDEDKIDHIEELTEDKEPAQGPKEAPPPAEQRDLLLPNGVTVQVRQGRGRPTNEAAKYIGRDKPYLVKWTDGKPEAIDNPDYEGESPAADS